MTNFSRSFAPKGACLLASLVLLAGCGCSKDSVASMDVRASAAAAETAFAEGDYQTALLCCQQSLSQNGSQVNIQILRARAALALDDFETAEEAADAAAKLRPADLAVLQIEAQVAFARDNLEKAYEIFSMLAKDESLSPATRAIGWCGRGVVAIKRINGDTGRNDAASSGDAARIDLMRAIQTDRRNAAAYYHLGYLYRNTLGFKQAAIDSFERYVGLMGETEDPHVAKASEAIRSLKDEIARETDNIPGSKARNTTLCAQALRRADAARKKNDLKGMVRAYEEALKADPLSFDAAYNLATCYEKQGTRASIENAYRKYRLTSVLRRGNAAALLAVGRLAEKLGYPLSGAASYSRAVALKWNDISALDGLIRTLRRSGNRTSANAYQRFRDSLPARR